jgi:hypothetical protein
MANLLYREQKILILINDDDLIIHPINLIIYMILDTTDIITDLLLQVSFRQVYFRNRLKVHFNWNRCFKN